MRRMREGSLCKAGGAVVVLLVGGVLAGCGLLGLLPAVPPGVPLGVTASFAQFDTSVQVTWTPVDRAASYWVLRANAQDGDFQRIGESTAPSYTDTVGEGNRGQLYWYKVEACNTAGCSARSAAVPGYAGYPPAPQNVRASQGQAGRITITWDPVPGATFYQVFRDRFPDGTFGVYLGESATTTMDDTTASIGTHYWYKVRACTPTACGNLSAAAHGYR